MRLLVFVPPDGPDLRRVSFFSKDLFSDSPGSLSDRQLNETQRHLEETSGSLGSFLDILMQKVHIFFIFLKKLKEQEETGSV